MPVKHEFVKSDYTQYALVINVHMAPINYLLSNKSVRLENVCFLDVVVTPP